ncbi:MAG: glycoside hydrolase family 30 protein [Actinomycetota bacterium]|nr:glycoside hydrolase family 30 protein [Actinomycetota bacterium]
MRRKKIVIRILIVAVIIPMLFLAISCNKESTVNAAADEVNATEEGMGTGKEIGKVSWKLSTRDEQWRDIEALSLFEEDNEQKADVTVDITSPGQEIDGFGGAFNEKGWEALLLLAPEKRDEVIKELFDPEEGAKFNICRVPIGASDYAISRYTLNEIKDDFEMENFSIERDREYIIPYIKAALEHRPDLQVWGSDWTPPTWMKTSEAFDGGNMKDDPRIYEAYALYLARFVEEYRNAGIDIFMVAVQNEPEIERNYPTCLWTPEQFLLFIRDYMGPLFEERNVGAEIMLGTIQDEDYSAFPKTVLSDPVANSYVSAIGFQWQGLYSVAQTRSNYPDKKIMQTETECGNFYWEPGYNPDFPQNDWEYGIHTWNKIKDYFNEGVNSYLLWNMILDEEGKSIDSEKPWPQNAAIVVDKNTKEVIYTPMFYAFKHFTFFVEEGANYITTSSTRTGAISFLNPDGEIIVILQNDENSPKDLKISTGEYQFNVTLPEMSWSTFIVPSFK